MRVAMSIVLVLSMLSSTALAQAPPPEDPATPPTTEPYPDDPPPAAAPPPHHPMGPRVYINPRNWRPGDPVPPGYAVETRMRRGLVIGGASLLGATWIISVITGGVGSSLELPPDSTDPIAPEDWYPLFAPVVGPWIAMATLESEDLGTTLLALDGLAQLAGLTMLILGATLKQTYIRPLATTVGDADVDLEEDVGVQVTPVFHSQFTGLSLSGQF